MSRFGNTGNIKRFLYPIAHMALKSENQLKEF